MSKRTTLLLASIMLAAIHLSAQAIDPARSTVTVHVAKAGLFSAFGHNHTIRAPIRDGEVNTQSRAVMLSFASPELRVLDPDVSLKDRAEIQRTMLGPQVLDVARFPEITFRSTRAEVVGRNGWRVHGELTLHGVTKPVALDVISGSDGGPRLATRDSGLPTYRGRVRLKQSDFGIQPVSVAGGTVKVKDEITVEFEIVLAR